MSPEQERWWRSATWVPDAAWRSSLSMTGTVKPTDTAVSLTVEQSEQSEQSEHQLAASMAMSSQTRSSPDYLEDNTDASQDA